MMQWKQEHIPFTATTPPTPNPIPPSSHPPPTIAMSFFNPFRRAQKENESGQITISVKWGKDRFNIPIPNPSLTPLSTLVATLSTQTSIPASQLKLIFNGAVLKDQSLTVSSYGIKDGSTLALVGKEGQPPSGPSGSKGAAGAAGGAGEPAPAPTTNATGPIRGKAKPPVTDNEQVLTDWVRQLIQSTLDPLRPSIVTFISNTNPNATNRPARVPTFEVLQKEHARISETLLRLLLDLDSVETQPGWAEARAVRKEGVKTVQAELQKVDAAWGEKKKLGN